MQCYYCVLIEIMITNYGDFMIRFVYVLGLLFANTAGIKYYQAYQVHHVLIPAFSPFQYAGNVAIYIFAKIRD